jgi:metal-responsive CopG/Arc/MetJ family transcriptional regulator
MNKIERVSAGVKFESDVLLVLDRMAAEHQRTRSFIINAIIRWYVKESIATQQAEWLERTRRLPAIQI